MAAFVRKLTFVACSLAISLSILKDQPYALEVARPECSADEQCLSTSGCSAANTRHTRLNLLLSNLPAHRYPLSHYIGLLIEFRRTLLSYTGAVLGVQRLLEENRLLVPVSERALRDLYPMTNETELLTAAGPEDVHRIFRESGWLLTSVEAHVQLLNAVNANRMSVHADALNVFHVLGNKSRHASSTFRDLLAVFSVTGLPAQATCVHTRLPRTVSSTSRAEFTSMAIRDIHQALIRIYAVLSSCQVQWRDHSHEHAKLHCQSETSAFYSSAAVQQAFNWLYRYSDVLAQ